MATIRGTLLLLAGLVASSSGAAAQTSDHDSAAEDVAPRFNLRGFADVDFAGRGGESAPDDTTGKTAFALGQFDLYMVSKLSDKISFLGETVFELDEQQEIAVDLERLQIAYRWSDALRLAAGRGHTALGYWNEAYHHGKLLQPTVERPEALKFEDDGGILPVHFADISLDELRRVFILKRAFWKPGKLIRVVLPGTGLPARAFLLDRVCQKTEGELRRLVLESTYRGESDQPPKVASSEEDALRLVSSLSSAVALVAADASLPPGVKTLRIDGKLPTDPGYPLAR